MALPPTLRSPVDERAWLIDGTAYVFRAFFSVRMLHAPDGTPVNALLGLANTLRRLYGQRRPRWVGVCFDAGARTFRNDIDPQYKANRGDPPEELVPQFDLCRALTEKMGLATYSRPGLEADDLLATLCADQRARGREVVLVSGDKDLGQLLGEGVRQYDLARDVEWGAEDLPDRMGVRAEQICDYLGLMGDSTDNIPGVRGVGPVAARALLSHFCDLNAIYEDLAAVEALPVRGAKSLRQRLEQGREDAERSRRLATLVLDAPLDLAEESLVPGSPRADWMNFCQRVGLAGFGQRWELDRAST